MSYRFVLVALLFSSAQADTINVGPGDSIQTAIDNAVDADAIIVAPGTYFKTINFLGKAVTLRSSGGAEVNSDGCTDVLDLLKLLGHYTTDPAGIGCPQ